MLFRLILISLITFGATAFSVNLAASTPPKKMTVVNKHHQVMAERFYKMVVEEYPTLEPDAKERVERFSVFIFSKMVPEKLEKVEFDPQDPTRFVLHFSHSHTGKIPKVEKGAETGFKSIHFKVKDKLSGFFSPEDQAIYLEGNGYSGKHSFFKSQYFLKKVQFNISGNSSEDIKLETDLGSTTKEWQENEMIATFKHMVWKKG